MAIMPTLYLMQERHRKFDEEVALRKKKVYKLSVSLYEKICEYDKPKGDDLRLLAIAEILALIQVSMQLIKSDVQLFKNVYTTYHGLY